MVELLKEYLNLDWFGRYSIYLKSKRWAKKRQKILERDNFLCQSCLENEATQVHHLTYDRVGCELAMDLISLCKDCHEQITTKSQISKLKLIELAGSRKDRYGNIIFGGLGDFLDSKGIDESKIKTLHNTKFDIDALNYTIHAHLGYLE